MRLMKRNCRKIYYQLYLGKSPVIDSDGYETGDTQIDYANPVELTCNVSPASGRITQEMFGTMESYDKVILTDQMDCPIDENSVLFVDTIPVIQDEELKNNHDYEVKRVAKSLNGIAYAVNKVKVSK